MGLFGALLGSVMSGAQQQQHETALMAVADLIHHPEVGGLSGMAGKFESAGLGHIMQGWVGNGANPAISPQQLTQVLGNQQIAAFASKLGIPTDQAASHLAQILPQVVNHLTPNGQIPSMPTNAQDVFQMLKSKL